MRKVAEALEIHLKRVGNQRGNGVGSAAVWDNGDMQEGTDSNTLSLPSVSALSMVDEHVDTPLPNEQQIKAEAFFRRNPFYFLWYYTPYDPKPYIDPATPAEMISELEAELCKPAQLISHFRSFSFQTNLPWSEEIVARFEDQWSWGDTTQWNDPVWEDDPRYLPDVMWGDLSTNTGLPWSISFIERFQHRFDWRWLSMNRAMPWSIELVERFSDKWEWKLLSFLHPWSPEIIDHFADRWNWDWLALNETICWSEEVVDRFDWFWLWTRLSRNPTLPWSVKFLEHYADRWDWITLSSNKGLPWSEEFIERYADRWSWEALGENPAIPWSASLVENLTRRLELGITKLHAYGVPWTREIIERFIDQWNWEALSENVAMPWSIVWIEQFAERWDWYELSGNRYLPWSIELIDRYIDRWDWTALSFNKGFQLSLALIERYADRWNGGEIALRTGELDIAWPASLAERMRPPKAIQGIVSEAPTFLSAGENELSRFNLTKQQVASLYVECTALEDQRKRQEALTRAEKR